ncbi:hypothetical protein CLV26_101586 [Parapedobacter indicus]|nr:hypothetical protein CLV26_101586 [Parapedobacter indicus]
MHPFFVRLSCHPDGILKWNTYCDNGDRQSVISFYVFYN